ncbi:hypothetical protein [Streptomyces sp. NPDC056244]|uniref:hypothetical protein n=1 Tax=Streptomyces sp. NPDC056244 TaxID=3345762 RepID=UPI0035E13761
MQLFANQDTGRRHALPLGPDVVEESADRRVQGASVIGVADRQRGEGERRVHEEELQIASSMPERQPDSDAGVQGLGEVASGEIGVLGDLSVALGGPVVPGITAAFVLFVVPRGHPPQQSAGPGGRVGFGEDQPRQQVGAPVQKAVFMSFDHGPVAARAGIGEWSAPLAGDLKAMSGPAVGAAQEFDADRWHVVVHAELAVFGHYRVPRVGFGIPPLDHDPVEDDRPHAGVSTGGWTFDGGASPCIT